MSSGARWIADERIGRHDLGERDNTTRPDAFSGGKDGDPNQAAPRTFSFVDCINNRSLTEWFGVMADAGLVAR